MAAPVIASVGTSVDSTLTPAVPVPSGVSSGSLVVAVVWTAWDQTSTAPTAAAVNVPSGFTVAQVLSYVDNGFPWYVGLFVCYKYATGADSGTYNFSFNSVGGSAPTADVDGGGVAFRVTGAPTSGNPFVDTWRSTSRSAQSSTTFTISTFTPGGDNSLLIGFGFINNIGSNTNSGPSGWTSDSNNKNDGILGVWHLAQTTAAATGTLTWTVGSNSSGVIGVGTIRPPSGTDYTASPSDAEGITDTAAAVQGVARTASDAEGISDAATTVQGLTRAPSDAEGITDTASAVQGIMREQDDSLGITDTVTANLTSGGEVAVDDPEGITDAVSTTAAAVRGQDDALGITDMVSVILNPKPGPDVTDRIILLGMIPGGDTTLLGVIPPTI